ncbi:MAG: lytic murein transglycosylase, partial [Haliea sp.]
MTRFQISPAKLPLFTAVLLLLLSTRSTAQSQPFEEWLAELRVEAAALEVSEDTLELAFSEITAPEPRIIENDRSQPERVQTYEDYLTARVSEWKVVNGRE